mmetsp:Transcript_1995/g.5020  ORF Transcript_1995/g.5020 Transcript_1995/m.5020 type:complete len:88 (-) Transcript_1995:27-290(-)
MNELSCTDAGVPGSAAGAGEKSILLSEPSKLVDGWRGEAGVCGGFCEELSTSSLPGESMRVQLRDYARLCARWRPLTQRLGRTGSAI